VQPVENPFDKIRQWAFDKGILQNGDAKTQTIKLAEEAGEIAKAVLRNDVNEGIDGIGDCVVVLTSLAHFHGVHIEACIDAAYNVIAKRTGKMQDGNFVKSEDIN
jgi:NTP pyrophosphatase (non-canonical NTP hydrolase)